MLVWNLGAKTMFNRCLALIIWSLAVCSVAQAEFHCKSVLHYKWKSDDGHEKQVHWLQVEHTGAEEKVVVGELEAEINIEKENARVACVKNHENLTGCVASKFSQQASVFRGLSFNARKALEDAIATDCKRMQGTCMTVESTDPVCVENKSEEELAAEAAAAEEAAGGDGKKNKKKKEIRPQ